MKKLFYLMLLALVMCTVSCGDDDSTEKFKHEAVDLGLSVKWATCNVGATAPEEYGNYYAWGETSVKASYNWSTYFDTTNDGCTFDKYNIEDGIKELDIEDDAATVNWGGHWRMPTYVELKELYYNCTWTLSSKNGVTGYKVTGKNGNSIFLPAAGYSYYSDQGHAGSYGGYWSSSLMLGDSDSAYYIIFDSSGVDHKEGSRCRGLSVRPVCE